MYFMWSSQSTVHIPPINVDSGGFDQSDRNHHGEGEGTIALRKRVLFAHQVKFLFLSGNAYVP